MGAHQRPQGQQEPREAGGLRSCVDAIAVRTGEHLHRILSEVVCCRAGAGRDNRLTSDGSTSGSSSLLLHPSMYLSSTLDGRAVTQWSGLMRHADAGYSYRVLPRAHKLIRSCARVRDGVAMQKGIGERGYGIALGCNPHESDLGASRTLGEEFREPSAWQLAGPCTVLPTHNITLNPPCTIRSPPSRNTPGLRLSL